MQYNTSFLSRNIVEVTNQFSNNFLQSIISSITEITLLIGILTILIFTEPFFTIVAFIIILPTGLLIYQLNKKKLFEAGKQSKFHWGERLKQIQQTFGGILEVKSFSKEKSFFEKFKLHNKIIADVSIKLSVINIMPKLIFEFLIILIICSGIFFLTKINYNLIDTIPIIGLFSYAFIRITPSLNRILVNMQRIRYSMPILEEIYYIKTYLLNDDNKNLSPILFNKNIKINNIEHEFTKSDPIFSNLNFQIEKNKMIGIFGESGSGKTTFLKILLGLIKPSKGDILSDDLSIFNNVKSWQSKIGYVPQNVYIMDESLKSNIALGVEDKSINLEKLNEVIKKTNLENFVNSLPNGQTTILGETGQRISGGQKQRIGIARALYTSPELLILDESTSNLDDDTEKQILNELKMIKSKLTIIIVSHRSTIKNYCDQMYKLYNKKIMVEKK